MLLEISTKINNNPHKTGICLIRTIWYILTLKVNYRGFTGLLSEAPEHFGVTHG